MTTIDLFGPTDISDARNDQTFVASMKRLWATFRQNRSQRRNATRMSRLNERLLRDIGVEPEDVYAAVEGRRAPSILFNPMLRLDHE